MLYSIWNSRSTLQVLTVCLNFHLHLLMGYFVTEDFFRMDLNIIEPRHEKTSHVVLEQV